jgi:hypothetical protein
MLTTDGAARLTSSATFSGSACPRAGKDRAMAPTADSRHTRPRTTSCNRTTDPENKNSADLMISAVRGKYSV